MKKLKLEVEDLNVESFETEALDGHGTVRAQETFESECQCGTGGGGGNSAESCTACGCDTPGYTCEERCWPETTAPETTEAAAVMRVAYRVC